MRRPLTVGVLATAVVASATPAGLHPAEVIWFDNGCYVELKDNAGQPATEVIVDPRTGTVSTEPGPAMMWNTRFGMMRAGGTGGPAGPVDSTNHTWHGAFIGREDS